MKRCISVLWLALMLASACTRDPQSGAKSQASTPSATPAAAGASDPLPSWNEVSTKKAITNFVARVSNNGSLPGAAPVPGPVRAGSGESAGADASSVGDERTVRLSAEGRYAKVLTSGSHGVAEILAVTHSGVTTDEFGPIVEQWLTTAKHPQTGRPYTDMVYQPMVELLTFLRANGFKTFIA